MMTTPSTSNIESSKVSGPNLTSPHLGPSQTSNPHSRFLNGPVAILWDIENCPVPSDVRPEDVSANIRMALRVHPVVKGVVTMFSAYGDFNAFPRRLREGCQRTGVKLIDVPNGRKDAADKAILVDMFLFALDNPPPSSILLISGDVDFAPALHILGQRGYTIILVIPAGVGVSSALCNAGRFVWDWPSVARGEGFVPPKAMMTRGCDLSTYLIGCHIGDNPDAQNDEESIVYKDVSQSEYCTRATCLNPCQVPLDFSRLSHSLEYKSNTGAMSCFPTSRSQSLPSGINEVPTGTSVSDLNGAQDPTSWVQPGDIQGLKGQMVKLLELSGGSMPLVRVSPEYQRVFGRPLYVAEYGAFKLVHLLGKMSETITVEGKGNRKVVYLRNKPGLNFSTPPCILKRDNKSKGMQDEITVGCLNVGSSDDSSDVEGITEQDDKNAETILWPVHGTLDNLVTFRQELQELLVSCSCKIPLSTFEALYEQRYKKALDYQSFGVTGLEEMIKKVRDVVMLHEEDGGKRKYVIASCPSG